MRPRYCDELYKDLIEYAELGPGKTVFEIGPGTGQATEPILKTGCSYLAIELGENFTEFILIGLVHMITFKLLMRTSRLMTSEIQNLIWCIQRQPFNGSPMYLARRP